MTQCKITLKVPCNPYEPKVDEHVIAVDIDPNTPDGLLLSSMLFGLNDNGVDVAPEVLDLLYDSPCRWTHHWNPVTKASFIRERSHNTWWTHKVGSLKKQANRKDCPMPGLTQKIRTFMQNLTLLRDEIYPKYVADAANKYLTWSQSKNVSDYQAFSDSRAQMFLVAEASGVMWKKRAIDDLRKAINSATAVR